MYRAVALGLLLLVPLAGASHSPEASTFLAGWYSSDATGDVAGDDIRFAPLYGFSPSTTNEDQTRVSAPFNYTITSMTVVAAADSCGGLDAGEQFNITLRMNNQDTGFFLTCTNDMMLGDTKVLNRTLNVTTGDYLNYRITKDGSLLGDPARFGISLRGEVKDVTNELLVTIETLAPLIIFLLTIVWAEMGRELWLYLLSAVAGIVAVIELPPEFNSIRILVVASILMIGIRTFGWDGESEETL